MEKGKVVKKKRKLRVKLLLKIFLFCVIFSFSFLYIKNLNVKNIVIKGNDFVKDVEIIELAGIKDYPKIFMLSKKDIKNSILTNPLIKDVKVKRNIFGKLTITVSERKILFFYKYNNSYITDDGYSIEDSYDIYGYPTLINFTPDTVFEDFVLKLNSLDDSIISMINEMEYSPYKSSDGTLIDDGRFKFKMNDSNTVIIDIVNMKKINDYNTIYASLGLDGVKGYLYLDTITEDKIYFKSYETERLELEEQKAKEENTEEE